MIIIKLGFLFSMLFFFQGCGTAGESETSQLENNNQSITVTADAGSDRTVNINETFTIEGKGMSSDGSQLSYLWQRNNEVLSSSATLEYTPVSLGIETLELIVKHKSGEVVTDTVKITVIEKRNNVEIPVLSSATIDKYLSTINQARASSQDCGKEGLFPATSPLSWSEKLYKSSYEHSYDMAYSKTFSHTGSGTEFDWTGDTLGKPSVLSERIEAYGYEWSYIGENIGAGTLIDTAEKMVEGWLASDAHCANLMSPNFEEVGMAMVKKTDAKYTHYWTQDFGTSR